MNLTVVMDISGVSAAGAVSAALDQKEVYSQQEVQVSVFTEKNLLNPLALIETLPSVPSNQERTTANYFLLAKMHYNFRKIRRI